MFLPVLILSTLVAIAGSVVAVEPCRIEVTERDSDWPVPMVELRTVSGIRLVSDNAGVIVCDAPELMGQEMWFYVHGQGYGVKPDEFGYEGIMLIPQPGETLRVEVDRRILARRIGRITGSGLYAESAKCGDKPLVEDSGIIGCDSVQTAIHRGRLHWVWGDSNLARYPLGIFHASSATSTTQPLASAEPPLVLSLDYFRDEQGFPRGVAPIDGEGPTWLFALVSLDDAAGTSHLVASYVKIAPPLSVWQLGLCEWNEATKQFERTCVLWDKADGGEQPELPHGHAAKWTDELGNEWVLLGNPFPTVKIPATYEGWKEWKRWERFEAPTLLQSTDGSRVKPHSGSIAWNGFRGRWVAIFMEAFGKPSGFGEIWYAEAESPFGPWGTAVKVLSHQNYSFYNPQIHPEFTSHDSPHLFFEGTYTTLFAGPTTGGGLSPTYPQATPRYDYNQMLYRLDLDDPALIAAQDSRSSGGKLGTGVRAARE
ncbi:MAG: hypothetical protein KDB11_28190 [Planctomycetales bacterium]|nr:hypothetical protein [Planctomycetales bacterium]